LKFRFNRPLASAKFDIMAPSPVTPPVALTIAGSDCSAGAGLQADLKAFSALGVYGLSAVTCVVAEVPGKVSMIAAVEPAMLDEQLRLLFSTFPVAAVKTGLLYSAELVQVVGRALDSLTAVRPMIVVDPVMVATSGEALVSSDAVRAYQEILFPCADLITPNLDELRLLTQRKVSTFEELRSAAGALAKEFDTAVLAKGGHLRGREACDFLVNETLAVEFRAPYVEGVRTHGTGCATSAAITAGLAKNLPLEEAVRQAKNFVSAAIEKICRWGEIDALNHHQF
jgi:hydroxymethylpyrimidine/phosphomethylpyrimidine kinase